MNADRLALIAQALQGASGQLALDRLLDAAIDVVSMASASIAVVGAGQHVGSLASTALATEVDHLQFSLGEGPCITAAERSGPLLEPDLDQAMGLWPAFAPAAIAIGVGGVFSFPLRVGPVQLGILTFYRTARQDLDPHDLADCLAIARIASHLLSDFEGTIAPGFLPAHLDEVIDQRVSVHQAAGMIAAQLACDVDEALARLRGHAWASDRPIESVAGDVIRRELRFDEL